MINLGYHFEFKLPGRILCVEGSASRLGRQVDRLGGTRVLVVTDPGVEAAGLVRPVVEGMDRGSAEVVGVFAGVGPDPDQELIGRCYGEALRREADCLLSVGGGSVIDTAKATQIMLAEGGELLAFQLEEYIPSGPVVPHVAVPTTAGTGSESTHIAMVVESRRRRKLIFHGAALAPRLAVLDPYMTLSMPPEVTAPTGIDALSHTVEALHSRFREPITDGLSLRAMELISGHLETAFREGGDIEARSNMLVAANMAGIAASNAFVGIVHAMAHSIGARFDVPHGVAVAIVLPYGMEHNLEFEGVAQMYRRAAASLGMDVAAEDDVTASRKAVERVAGLVDGLGMPGRLRDVGVPRDALATLAADTAGDRSMVVNPGETTEEDILGLLERAY